MVRARTWTVEITVREDENGRRTYTDAVLRAVRPLPGDEGEAGLPPSEQELADLAYRVVDVAATGPHQFPYRPMRMLS